MPTEHEKTAASNRSTNGVSPQTSGTSSLHTVIRPTRRPLGSKLAERFDCAGPRGEQPARQIASQVDELVDEIFRSAELEQVLAQRSALALGATFEPEGGKLIRIAAEPHRYLILEGSSGDGVEVDKRVPEIEDDRAGHALRTRTAVP
jgi:hypothetical protein